MASTTSDNADMRDDVERVTNRPFRFKRKHDKDSKARGGSDSGNGEPRHGSHRHHHRHRRSHKRQRLSDEGSEFLPRSYDAQLSPDVAFRESLFDAMGDDEGAAFWQGIYGQPIHTYPRTFADVETGELGTMDDEEYARYVRRRMWEKSTEGLEAAKEARIRQQREDQARREQEQPQEQRERGRNAKSHQNYDFVFDIEIEKSLQRGARRRDEKRWQEIWKAYQDKWQQLQAISQARKSPHADNSEQLFLRNKIAWPVESDKCKDVGPEEVERFIDRTASSKSDEQSFQVAKTNLLKNERIRWHPDKIQQRYGFMQIDEGTMAGVTAVFQILDRIWNELRNQQG